MSLLLAEVTSSNSGQEQTHTHMHPPQLIITDGHMATSGQQCGCHIKDRPNLGVAPTVPHPLLYHVCSLPESS